MSHQRSVASLNLPSNPDYGPRLCCKTTELREWGGSRTSPEIQSVKWSPGLKKNSGRGEPMRSLCVTSIRPISMLYGCSKPHPSSARDRQ